MVANDNKTIIQGRQEWAFKVAANPKAFMPSEIHRAHSYLHSLADSDEPNADDAQRARDILWKAYCD